MSCVQIRIGGDKKIRVVQRFKYHFCCMYPLGLTLNLPTTTIVAQPFNVIQWQLKFNPVA